ncbi:hypothetical protein HK098_007763 [Nowakowskiella sp. JEL0407]|nr:hypothetical protein HK098_007763 [Nowakowskiella sp. JEL0407]
MIPTTISQSQSPFSLTIAEIAAITYCNLLNSINTESKNSTTPQQRNVICTFYKHIISKTYSSDEVVFISLKLIERIINRVGFSDFSPVDSPLPPAPLSTSVLIPTIELPDPVILSPSNTLCSSPVSVLHTDSDLLTQNTNCNSATSGVLMIPHDTEKQKSLELTPLSTTPSTLISITPSASPQPSQTLTVPHTKYTPNSPVQHNQTVNQAPYSLTISPRLLILTSLILAHKFHQDKRYPNAAWSRVGGVSVGAINKAERDCLECIGYNFFIGVDEYECWRQEVVSVVWKIVADELADAARKDFVKVKRWSFGNFKRKKGGRCDSSGDCEDGIDCEEDSESGTGRSFDSLPSKTQSLIIQ